MSTIFTDKLLKDYEKEEATLIFGSNCMFYNLRVHCFEETDTPSYASSPVIHLEKQIIGSTTPGWLENCDPYTMVECTWEYVVSYIVAVTITFKTPIGNLVYYTAHIHLYQTVPTRYIETIKGDIERHFLERFGSVSMYVLSEFEKKATSLVEDNNMGSVLVDLTAFWNNLLLSLKTNYE